MILGLAAGLFGAVGLCLVFDRFNNSFAHAPGCGKEFVSADLDHRSAIKIQAIGIQWEKVKHDSTICKINRQSRQRRLRNGHRRRGHIQELPIVASPLALARKGGQYAAHTGHNQLPSGRRRKHDRRSLAVSRGIWGDYRILLVDTNVAQPSIHRMLRRSALCRLGKYSYRTAIMSDKHIQIYVDC